MGAEHRKVNDARRRSMAERQAEFIDRFREHPWANDCCDAMGIAYSTYKSWRSKTPEFAQAIDAIRDRAGLGSLNRNPAEGGWDGSFTSFRAEFLGMGTPAHQREAVTAYESTAPGTITLILWPPEHGKTTLFEDYATWKLSIVPTYRMVVGSESLTGMSRKILSRVKNRLDPATSEFKDLIARFGPFRKPLGEPAEQPWAADYFNVWKKGGHDERDYSMVALGIGSGIAGTRTDHLHADDIQSKRNESQTPQIVDTFRQDWLTRPGQSGRTTMNGTRVGEGDVYETLEQEIGPDLLRIIRLPAITVDDDGVEHALWPEVWPLEALERQRKLVGEEAWSRNYMQDPLIKGHMTFSDEECLPTIRKAMPWWSSPGEGAVGNDAVISLDPSIEGKNCVAACGMIPGELRFLGGREREDLRNNEQVIDEVEWAVLRAIDCGWSPSEVVIEDKAFQKGLMADRQLQELAARHGLSVRGHQTGENKYDDSIGIPSMARDMRLGRIAVARGIERADEAWIDELDRQLRRWRPYRKGNRLRQDRLMALWFAWIIWRQRNYHLAATVTTTEQFGFRGMPYTPTRAGVLVPSGAW